MLRTLGSIILFAAVVLPPSVKAETVADMLAAQIRIQGHACDKAVGAVQDKKRSRPDHDVWVLKCSNATYRVSRAPDMAAKVETLRSR
jgi:predicted lipid carrier protein YhbT